MVGCKCIVECSIDSENFVPEPSMLIKNKERREGVRRHGSLGSGCVYRGCGCPYWAVHHSGRGLRSADQCCQDEEWRNGDIRGHSRTWRPEEMKKEKGCSENSSNKTNSWFKFRMGEALGDRVSTAGQLWEQHTQVMNKKMRCKVGQLQSPTIPRQWGCYQCIGCGRRWRL